MSIPCTYRPVIFEYPHDVAMGPLAGPQAREVYLAALDTISPERLVEAAESLCELIAEDFDIDDASADRVFGVDGFGFDVAAAAATPAIASGIRAWIVAGIDEACWEARRTTAAGVTAVENYVEHIGGHPYTVVVTNDDTTYVGLLLFKSLFTGCVTCHPCAATASQGAA
ncbi:hypothetical protein [Prescottella subtropica]|uniref:hypothetical protein n=1 Tax=Prescottella subtropica TaxID=2545757 RepID=UPI0010F9A8B8|nr:hypothetical protein [Prescottella subtropica]